MHLAVPKHDSYVIGFTKSYEYIYQMT